LRRRTCITTKCGLRTVQGVERKFGIDRSLVEKRGKLNVVAQLTSGSNGHVEQSTPGKEKTIDVVALNNLCVDVFVEMEELPPLEKTARMAALEELVSSPPPSISNWEVGGASNFAIAAVRLGLSCTCLGHTGQDRYGQFMTNTLEEEGVQVIQLADCEPGDDSACTQVETLVCWVMMNRCNEHQFCSRFDFTTVPLLDHLPALPPAAQDAINQAQALMLNGFVFDELTPATVLSAVMAARRARTAVFFDVGPRGTPLQNDVPAGGKAVLREVLRLSDVVLLTEEEAEMVTGQSDPHKAAEQILHAEGSAVKWVVLKMGGEGCFILTRDELAHHPAMCIQLEDTVGCGDSLAAAVVLGYINGLALRPTLSLANAVGGATATRRGAGRNVATAEAARQLLLDCAVNAEVAHRESAREALRILDAASSGGTRPPGGVSKVSSGV